MWPKHWTTCQLKIFWKSPGSLLFRLFRPLNMFKNRKSSMIKLGNFLRMKNMGRPRKILQRFYWKTDFWIFWWRIMTKFFVHPHLNQDLHHQRKSWLHLQPIVSFAEDDGASTDKGRLPDDRETYKVPAFQRLWKVDSPRHEHLHKSSSLT